MTHWRALTRVGVTVLLAALALLSPAQPVAAATVEVAGSLVANTTWTADNVYVINGDLTIPEAIKLTIAPGTVVKLKGRGSIFVRGILDARGSAGSPIVFTSFQDDAYGGDTDGDGVLTPAQRGDWGSIQFDDTSADAASFVRHAIIRYGGLERFGCCDDTLRGGITLNSAEPTLANLSFQSNLINGVGIPGGARAATSTASQETWHNTGMVYVVLGDLTVDPGFTLNISPGMTVKFAGGRVSIFVRGALAARGTAGAPITFTSLNDDAAGGDTDGDGTQTPPAQQDWGFIQFEDSSDDAASVIEHATLRYSGLERFGCCDDTRRGPVTLANAQPTLANLSFSGNYVNGVGIVGGSKAPTATVTGETWANTGMVYVLLGDVVLEEGFKLTIAPGMIIKSGGRTSMFVRGALDARGTAAAPIVFTSLNDDTAGGDTDGDGAATPPQKDDWGFVQYEDSSDDAASFVEHASFRYSGLERFGCCDDTRRAALTLASAQPTLANLSFVSNHIGAVGVAGGTRTADERWANPGVVYVVLWDVVVDPGVKLTIAPGMIIKFEGRTSLFVRGALDARGTPAAPITFTSLQDDSAGGDSDNDGALTPPQKHNWGWVQLEDSTDDAASFVEHAAFRYSGLERFGCCDDTYSAALTLVNAQPTLANLSFAANHVSAVGIAGGARTANETWGSTTVTYAVIGDVIVPQGFKLTVGPGVIVKLAGRTSIFVNGAFAARGTPAAPITFTSLQDDTIGGDSDADGTATPPGPQDWGWIQLDDSSDDANSGIEYAVLRYGGLERFGCCDDTRAAALVLRKAAPLVARTVFTDNHRGIDLVGGALPQLVCNDILGNQGLGIGNDTPATVVSAAGQWWGSPAGPTHPSNPNGNGQAVGNGVIFEPWATQSCLASAPPPDELAVTIVELRDSVGGGASTVEGNRLTAQVDVVNRGGKPVQATVQLLDTFPASPTALATASVTVSAGQSQRLTLSFGVERMAWSAGERTLHRPLVARIQTGDGIVITSPAAQLEVSPRPVMLVHGYNDTGGGWAAYVGNNDGPKYLPAIGIQFYANPTFKTGNDGPLALTNTVDQNARELMAHIKDLKGRANAEQVDIVAHSMGGLISRRYIARYMSPTAPDVNRLIMLGTPNAGTRSATAAMLSQAVVGLRLDKFFPVRYPAIAELTQSSVRLFNFTNSERHKVKFYAVAGNYLCPRNLSLPANPLEEDPDDVAVARSSVFAIRLDGRWTYPGPNSPGCGGNHLEMRSASSESGASIFALYVAPILKGIGPTNAPELQPTLVQAAAEPPADPLQYTTVQTATVRAGAPVTLVQSVEAGASASFIVIGAPGQFSVRLRSPGGAEYTPASAGAGVEYAQLAEGLVPMTIYKVANPEAGAWQVIVEATAQAPASGVVVAAVGAVESSIQLIVSAGDPAAGQAGLIRATLRSGAAAVTGATVKAELQAPSGARVSLTLRDDGASDDGAAGDGVYAATATAQASGVYTAVVTATGTAGGASFTRSDVWSAELVGGRLFLPLLRR